MRRVDRGFIYPQEAAYVDLLISDRDSANVENGLERLCKLYRSGYRLRNPLRIITHLVGLLHSDAPKVRRWALNALALVGTRVQVGAVLDAIQRERLNPDILGAGISALSAMVYPDEARTYLEKADLPLRGAVLLAAAQQSSSFQNELRKTRVDIDYADPSELRLATLLVGLNRAPDNLFSTDFPNGEVIGHLNAHPDPIVAQYSVWAIYENPGMSIRDLGVPMKDTESQPPNVRKYIYRLVAADNSTARANHDLLVVASEDISVEAREGLAAGIRDVYFDSLERMVLDWFADEENGDVRQRLLEHMAANAAKFPGYTTPVLTTYRDSQPNSLVRARLESAARGTDLFVDMRVIALDVEKRDLFAQASQSTIARHARERARRVKVLVVTALAKEAAAVKATLDQHQTVVIADDPHIYELGVYKNNESREQREVLLACSGVGKPNASVLATNAMRSFPEIEHLIMVGIAGGCPNSSKPDEHVRLGDVVVSGNSGVIEYDFVKESIDGREIRSSPQKPSAKLLGIARHLQSEEMLRERPWEVIAEKALGRLGDNFGRPDLETDILHIDEMVVPHPPDAGRRKNQPRIHAGTIGTADTLQKDPSIRDMLRDDFGVRAIEMEASGIQIAAWARGRDVFVVRGICDYCDRHKNDTWQNYAAMVAAAYARALIEAMPTEWF